VNKNLIVYGIVALIILLAVVFRIVGVYPIVFGEDGNVYLLGIDPIFYLRQVETTIKNFPLLQKFDHATHYPGGLNSDATGLYPWAVAGIIKLFYGSNPSSNTVAAFMAWVPVLFTALSYGMVYRITTKLRNNIAGIFSIFLLLVYPGLFLYRGILGFPDHHILEVFFGLWLMNSLLNAKKYSDSPSAIKIPLLAAIPLVLFFTIWPGAHLFLLLSALVIIILIIVAKESEIKSVGKFGFLFFLTSSIGYYLIYFLYPDFITSSFAKYDSQVGLFMLAAGILVYAGSCIIKFLNERFNPKIYQPILFLVLVFSLAIFFNYFQMGKEILGRLTFKAQGVAENRAVNWVSFIDMVLVSGLVSGIYLVYLAVVAFLGRLNKMTDMVFVFLTGFFIFMWMSTYDMGYMIAPFISIVAGVALYDFTIWSITKENTTAGRSKIIYQAIPYVLIGICFILPILRNSPKYPYALSDTMAANLNLYKKPWYDAMDWLKSNTPALKYPTDEIFDRSVYQGTSSGNYAILSAWDNGNMINQRGHRIPMWSRWPGEKVESLMLYHPDSLKNYLIETDYAIDYLVVDDRMASIFFMSKYQLLPGYSAANCMDTTYLQIQGQDAQLSNYDPCYKESLIYKTYVENDSSITWIDQVYASEAKTVIGYFVNAGSLMLRNIDYDYFNEEQIQAIESEGYLLSRQGLFFDVFIRPKVQIFKINRALLEDDLSSTME
jgi:dolichyl-diphosphooligosaccharide--protein glycosyltransferase